jgi:pSer/pThr/pTyr-binding forkhead associated (FHA) protein
MASLCLLNEDGAVIERWEVGDQPIAIGRDATADVTIDDAALSRRHFLICREGGQYLIKDLDSQNGTWVDGQRAQGTKLRQNDCIVAGRTLFLFREHALPDAVGPGGPLPAHDSAFLPAAIAAARAAHPPSLEQTG